MEPDISRREFGLITVAATGAVATECTASAQDAGPRRLTRAEPQDNGAVFNSSKPYFPMLLGNGKEHVLIGYSGTMGACAGHEHWSYGTIGNLPTVTGWFRPDSRNHPVRGVVNLLQCGYILQRGIHADGLDGAEQVFDAQSGILFTNCHFANAEVRVKTFLTSTSLLVHRFKVKTEAESMWIQFFVRAPLPEEPLSLVTDPDKVNLPEDLDKEGLAFVVKGAGWTDTVGRLFSDHPKARKVTCYNGQPGVAVPLTGEAEFSFVVQCTDAGESRQETISQRQVVRFDYRNALRRHEAEWQHFDSQSEVNISHGSLSKIYRTSLYAIRAHQHPDMGGITVGAYPGMWTNGINSYDVSYGLMALLGASRLAEAARVVQFWKRILPLLRERAERAGLPGIACPAPMSPWGESFPKSREEILEERHFITANITLHVWQLYQYSGRLSVLRNYWECLTKPVEFLLGACVDRFPDHAEIIRSSGPNGKERIDGKVVYHPNPIRTLLATIEAVRAVSKAARLLGRSSDPRWAELLPKLERGIEANRFEGVIRANRNPKAPPRADASYVGLFNCLTDRRTLFAEIEHYTGPNGFMRWPDHGYLAVPWSHLNVSAAFSRLGLPGPAARLETAARFTTTLHGIPEAVRPDGAYYKTWYPTVHSAFVHATNLLLVCPRDGWIELFAGLPADWGDAQFRSLRVPVGLVVTASRRGGQVSAEITNDSDQLQSVRVRATGPEAWEKAVSIEPGETAALPS